MIKTTSVKFIFLFITILASVLHIKSVNANPSSCKASAITTSERKAVKILQDMYEVQSKMELIDKNLDELNRQRSLGYDPYDSASVNRYNDITEKYNSIVGGKNALSDKYNLLKVSFNTLAARISPSINNLFITCLNIAVLDLNVNTSRHNINSNALSIDSLNIETENMRREIESMNY